MPTNVMSVSKINNFIEKLSYYLRTLLYKTLDTLPKSLLHEMQIKVTQMLLDSAVQYMRIVVVKFPKGMI